MSNIFQLTVSEIAEKIKKSDLNSVDLCKSYIEQIEKFEKDVKAWAHFDKKLLLEKAEEADNHRRSGKPVGPLHGIPVALKDIIGTYDMPTECGTVLRKGKTESQNAEIVDLLKSAGALTLNPDVLPGAKQIADIQDLINDKGIKCIFSEPQYNPKIIETLGNDMNISTGVMDPLGAYIDAGPSMYSDLINGIANSIKDCH